MIEKDVIVHLSKAAEFRRTKYQYLAVSPKF
jgi:hypothetical protein